MEGVGSPCGVVPKDAGGVAHILRGEEGEGYDHGLRQLDVAARTQRRGQHAGIEAAGAVRGLEAAKQSYK